MRNTWHNFEKALKGNTIVSKLDLVYPIKNGIAETKKKENGGLFRFCLILILSFI